VLKHDESLNDDDGSPMRTLGGVGNQCIERGFHASPVVAVGMFLSEAGLKRNVTYL
jgi:hypothetical protein